MRIDAHTVAYCSSVVGVLLDVNKLYGRVIMMLPQHTGVPLGVPYRSFQRPLATARPTRTQQQPSKK
jgi:hypothetical protein